MNHQEINYQAGSVEFRGYLAYPENAPEKKLPAILVAPTWLGRDEFACQKAREVAGLGYAAFAVDQYGNGKVAAGPEEAAGLTQPLFIQRALLQSRIIAAFECLCAQPHVDSNQIGGIGFCFGGLMILELLRSGADVKGIVSFHGVLGNHLGDVVAKPVPIAPSIKGAALFLHGYQDPLVTNNDIVNLQKELTDAQVDWQFNTYGLAGHSFTNPEQNKKASGLYFEPKANARSWEAMKLFFKELF
ncbi:MAG: dienelactone hydrolase family protein [Candidatus Protochlamydia sp.]|nr:dienelactone hydrolase family protein [Candidatus Protochlamydia sp.]